MRTIVLALIRVYQRVLSPILGQNCRFHPTCSQYSYRAIQTHGVLRGTKLAVTRILKCHPWHAGGIDEVPEVRDQHG